MLKNRILYLIAVIAELFFFALFYGAFGWQLLLFTLLLPVFSLLVTAFGLRRIDIKMQSAERVVRGEHTVLSVTSAQSTIPSTAVKVYLTVDGQGGKPEKEALLLGAEGAGHFTLCPLHCARMSCRISKIKVYDHLGLFSLHRKLDSLLCIDVMPIIGDVTEYFASAMSDCCQPPSQGGYSEIYELREYRPGDQLRSVHWKLSQKTDRLLVKEPQASDNSTAVLTVDILPPCDAFDNTLDALVSASAWMLERDLVHDIRWRGENGICTAKVGNAEQLNAAVSALLSARYLPDMPTLRDTRFDMPHYHIDGAQWDFD